jgi:hypothetical protein
VRDKKKETVAKGKNTNKLQFKRGSIILDFEKEGEL